MSKLLTLVFICVVVLLIEGCGTSKVSFGFEYKWGVSGSFNERQSDTIESIPNPKSPN